MNTLMLALGFQVEGATAGGMVKAKGIIKAMPRARQGETSTLRQIGTFDARAQL